MTTTHLSTFCTSVTDMLMSLVVLGQSDFSLKGIAWKGTKTILKKKQGNTHQLKQTYTSLVSRQSILLSSSAEELSLCSKNRSVSNV